MIPTAPTEPFQLTFAKTYYPAQHPAKQPLYNGRPGATMAPMLTQPEIDALVSKCIAAGITIDEQIDYWGWDPYTVMSRRFMEGVLWVKPGMGNVVSTEVITPGEFSGPMPSGAIKTSLNLADYPAWPTPTPAVTNQPDPVGDPQIGPYYAALGTNPPATWTDSRGTFKLKLVPNSFAIGGGGMMKFYVLS